MDCYTNCFISFILSYAVVMVTDILDQKCIASKAFRSLPGMDQWCETNCLRYPPNCPETACYCPTECVAIGELEGKEGADTYCIDACLNYNSKCPIKKCRCF